jgi:nucleoside-diphosphate-sugar epimerase
MSQAHKLFDINVGGTRRLLELGVQLGIRFFVYTSTVNVVFGGDHPPAIINGREDMPYCPLERHCDDYARTKSLAEQAVLAMDRQGGPLRTCAVRPNAIYGEGEERHLPRILWYAERGLLQFKVGSPSSLQDWVHVDNLCLGELLALRSLATPECRAGGRAFNISDGSPVNTNKFVGTIVERVGFVQRDLWLPYSLVFAMGRGVELAYRLVHRCYDFDPVLIRSEVNKTALTHWFSLEAARRDLGYKPMFDTSVGLERTASWFAANYRPTSAAYWRRLKVFALACATLLAAWAAATLANRTW